MRIGTGDVGARVVVRHRIAGGGATDVVGELLSAGDGVVTVRTAQGAVVRVAADDVVASRVVGGATTASATRSQQGLSAPAGGSREAGGPRVDVMAVPAQAAAAITALGWQGRSVQPLGGWLLRSGPGVMMRGRSALVTGDPGVPLPQALDAVVDHYRALGLRPAVQVPRALPAAAGHGAAAETSSPPAGDTAVALERLLAASGWQPQPWTVLAVRAPALHLPGRHAPASSAGAVAVDLSPSPDAGWLAASDHHGAPLARSDLPPERDGVAVGYASAREPWSPPASSPVRPLGVARGALAVRWLGITCVAVAPGSRRRGAARALLAALEADLGAGADAVYVQVLADNHGARATWRALGFADHSRYRFWTLPGLEP